MDSQQACDILNEKKKKLLDEVEKWKKSSDDFRKDLVETNKLHVKKAAEIKKLKEDNDQLGKLYHLKIKTSDSDIDYLAKERDNLKQKIEEMLKPIETYGEKFAKEAEEK